MNGVLPINFACSSTLGLVEYYCTGDMETLLFRHKHFELSGSNIAHFSRLKLFFYFGSENHS